MSPTATISLNKGRRLVEPAINAGRLSGSQQIGPAGDVAHRCVWMLPPRRAGDVGATAIWRVFSLSRLRERAGMRESCAPLLPSTALAAATLAQPSPAGGRGLSKAMADTVSPLAYSSGGRCHQQALAKRQQMLWIKRSTRLIHGVENGQRYRRSRSGCCGVVTPEILMLSFVFLTSAARVASPPSLVRPRVEPGSPLLARPLLGPR